MSADCPTCAGSFRVLIHSLRSAADQLQHTRLLTLHAAWAFAFWRLGKRIENRTWSPPVTHPGRAASPERVLAERTKVVLIHAGAKYGETPSARATVEVLAAVARRARAAGLEVTSGRRGLSVTDDAGTRLWNAGQPTELDRAAGYPVATMPLSAIVGAARCTFVGPDDRPRGQVRPWGVPGSHWWVADEWVPFETPIPYVGQQGWRVPDDIPLLATRIRDACLSPETIDALNAMLDRAARQEPVRAAA